MNPGDADLKRRAEERVGRVLREKWQLDALLGLGGMAAVYAATHRNGKRAAIKILHPEAAMVPDIRARFLREGYLANKVGHAGAVSILDDDTDVDGTVFIVMELLDGETLEARWVAQRTLQWEFALVVAHKMLEVLAVAHGKGIVHRDLKPANVFLDVNGSVKILDFGIARLQSVTAQAGATGRDMALGTPGFMPPEQARGHWDKVDQQSDLWALGATLFALITGRLVHEAETVNEQLLLAMTRPHTPIKEIVVTLPDAVAAIIDRALAFDKSGRFADAQSMQSEVRTVYEALTKQSIADAISVSIGARSRSVHPNAPTLAAPEPLRNQGSTARPVEQSTAPERPRSKLAPFVIAAAAAAVVALALVARRASHPPATDGNPVAAEGVPTPAVAPAAPAVHAALPASSGPSVVPVPMPVVPAPVDSVSGLQADSALLKSGAKPGKNAPAPAKANKAAGAPSAAPAKPAGPDDDSDMFTRRK